MFVVESHNKYKQLEFAFERGSTISKHRIARTSPQLKTIASSTSSAAITGLATDDVHLFSTDNAGQITSREKPEFNIFRNGQSHSSTYIQSLHVDNQFLYGGTIWEDCSIKLYDKLNLELKKTLTGPLGTVFTLVSDDDFLFSGTGDSRVIIWDKKDWSQVGSVNGQRHFVLSLIVDEKHIYAGGIDDCTNVFTRDDLSQVTSLEGHKSNVLSLTTDENYLYSGSGELWWGGPGSPRPPHFESAVRVWAKRDWTCIAVLTGHTDNVNAVTTDSRFVYSVSDDSTLRIYSKKDWNELFSIAVDARRIETMTADEQSIYIGCSDGSIRQLSKDDLEV